MSLLWRSTAGLRKASGLSRHRILSPPSSPAAAALLHGLPPRAEEAYDDEPDYPKLDTHRNKFEKDAADLADLVGSLRTVEERLWYLNKPKYFGWHSIVMDLEKVPYGCLDFVKSTTRSHVVEGLPEGRYSDKEKASRLASELAPRLERLLLRDREMQQEGWEVANDRIPRHEAHAYPQPKNFHSRARRETAALARSVHKVIMSGLRREAEHLRTAQVDLDSRTEAFWFKAGFPPDRRFVYQRLTLQKAVKDKKFFLKDQAEFTDEDVHRKDDKAVQILGRGLVKIRGPEIIPPFVSVDDPLCRSGEDIPKWEYNARTSGFTCKHQNGVNNPGYWTCSDSGQHTSLQLVSSDNFWEKETNVTARNASGYREEMLTAKGLLHSYGQLMPEACYLGYGPFHNPESPLAIQTAVTDGRRFKLCAFQLNQTSHHMPVDDGKERDIPNNVFWHCPEFDLILADEESGREKVNLEGLTSLVQFYLQEPSVRHETDVMTWDQIGSNYNREYFFHDFRLMQARGFRGDYPETEAWERIYRLAHPVAWFPYGWRDRPWHKMAKMDFKGREHWHPAFKHWDHYETKKIPRIERENKHESDNRKRKIVPPVPEEDQNTIFWRQPSHGWGKFDGEV